MGLLKRRQKATADIRFVDHTNKAAQPTRWTSKETVEGVAYFRIPPGSECTHASAAFKGVVTIRKNESSPGSLQPSWRTKRVKFLSVGKELRSSPLVRSDAGLVQAPFQFDLPECLRFSTLESGLPSSIDSKREGRDHKSFHKQDGKIAYDVTYTITASAFSSRGLIVSESQDILLLSVGQSDPPSYGSPEVAGEYYTARTETHSKRGAAQVDLAGQEPSPLVLRARSGGSDPSTSVNLMLKVSPEDSDTLSRLPQQAHVRTQLIQKTLVSPNGARLSDDGRRIRDPDSQFHTSKLNVQECTVAIPQWQTYQPDQETHGFAIARLSLLYRYPVAESLTATFSTPILSRSYALEVKVSFPEDGLQGLKLTFPVQVTYESAAPEMGAGDLLERKATARSHVNEIPKVAR